MSLTSELRVKFKATETGSNDLAAQRYVPELEKVLQFTDGTTANKADLVWADTRTIAASGSEDLDLAGELTTAFGDTLAAPRWSASWLRPMRATPTTLFWVTRLRRFRCLAARTRQCR